MTSYDVTILVIQCFSSILCKTSYVLNCRLHQRDSPDQIDENNDVTEKTMRKIHIVTKPVLTIMAWLPRILSK